MNIKKCFACIPTYIQLPNHALGIPRYFKVQGHRINMLPTSFACIYQIMLYEYPDTSRYRATTGKYVTYLVCMHLPDHALGIPRCFKVQSHRINMLPGLHASTRSCSRDTQMLQGIELQDKQVTQFACIYQIMLQGYPDTSRYRATG